MREGYYVYSYSADGGGHKEQWMWTATLFCKNLPHTPALKKGGKKNGISYSHARVYIFYLEVDVTLSRATGGFESLTMKNLQQSHCY
jgi:hypothetical protein